MKPQLFFAFLVLLLASLACDMSFMDASTPLPPPSITPTVTLTPTFTLTPTPTVTPTPPLTTSSGPVLLELHMFSPTRGWGLTEDQILITRDGGSNWAQVPLPNVTFNSSFSKYFIDQDIAYFLVPLPDAELGQFFATRDGGATWNITPAPFKNGQFYFVNDNEGFVFQMLKTVDNFMTVAIYQTLNRGETWDQVFINTPDQDETKLPVEGLKTGLSFIDPSLGFIGLRARENSIDLYSTDNAGRNWRKVALPTPNEIGDTYQSTVWPPSFFRANGTDGFLAVDVLPAAASAPSRTFYYTRDAGATWKKGGQLPDSNVHFFLDPEIGWAWSEHSLYITRNGAKTWELIPVAFSPRERARLIDFVDAQNGWLITIDHKNVLRMYRSVDGGVTWAAIIP